jgi:uncharacterized membrane protein YqjE
MFKAQWDTPVIVAVFIWLCLLPLVAWLVVPFFGWEAGFAVAAVLLVLALSLCWLLCLGPMTSLSANGHLTRKDLNSK